MGNEFFKALAIAFQQLHTTVVKASSLRLRSGREFSLLRPDFVGVPLGDMVGALAFKCRFSGQVQRFWTVAQHLLLCDVVAQSDGLNAEQRLPVVLHDLHECVTGDVSRPMRAVCPQFQRIEAGCQRAIGRAFRVDFDAFGAIVDEIDDAVLWFEQRNLGVLPPIPPTNVRDVTGICREAFDDLIALSPANVQTRLTGLIASLTLSTGRELCG